MTQVLNECSKNHKGGEGSDLWKHFAAVNRAVRVAQLDRKIADATVGLKEAQSKHQEILKNNRVALAKGKKDFGEGFALKVVEGELQVPEALGKVVLAVGQKVMAVGRREKELDDLVREVSGYRADPKNARFSKEEEKKGRELAAVEEKSTGVLEEGWNSWLGKILMAVLKVSKEEVVRRKMDTIAGSNRGTCQRDQLNHRVRNRARKGCEVCNLASQSCCLRVIFWRTRSLDTSCWHLPISKRASKWWKWQVGTLWMRRSNTLSKRF